MKKQLPIGLSDYKILIDENYYYIDKTLFIDDILQHGGRVTLLPRPRRFGKTLNISMLKYFFEKTDTNHAYLFEDKKIWQLPERVALHGKFPVIFLTFKDIKQSTWQDTREKLIATIAAEYKRHQYLLNSELLSENEKAVFNTIIVRKAINADYHYSLKNLSEFLYRYHNIRPIVLIDEYDSPIHAGFIYDYYADVIEFIRGIMVAVFKDNSFLERGVITGILRTAKEGIFSGLNNLKMCTVLDEKISDKFGFTQQEIDQLLHDYNLSAIHDEFKNWYNGYLIGNTKVYNPWSTLNCIDQNGIFKTYWVNTSDNALIYKIVAQSDIHFKDTCADLITGTAITNIKIEDQMTLPDMMQNPNSLWSLFLFSGYVTACDSRIIEGIIYADLIVPNKELHVLFKNLVNDLFTQSLNRVNITALYDALRTADGETFEELISTFIMRSVSYHDISEDEPEKSYHLFVLGLCIALADQYTVLSNRESGHGRFDIMLIPHIKSNPGIVIEFKKMRKNETMQECAHKALTQIKERNYAAQLQHQGAEKIVAFGIAIHKKEVLLIQENL